MEMLPTDRSAVPRVRPRFRELVLMPDSQPASGQDVERVAPIIDPGLSPEARDQAAGEIRRAGSEAGETSAGCGFMLTIGGVIAVLVLRVAAGLSWRF